MHGSVQATRSVTYRFDMFIGNLISTLFYSVFRKSKLKILSSGIIIKNHSYTFSTDGSWEVKWVTDWFASWFDAGFRQLSIIQFIVKKTLRFCKNTTRLGAVGVGNSPNIDGSQKFFVQFHWSCSLDFVIKLFGYYICWKAEKSQSTSDLSVCSY